MPSLPTLQDLTDPLSRLLEVMRPSSYMFRAIDAGGDWALRYPGVAGLRCYALTHGALWMHIDGEPHPRRLEAGSCLVLTRRQAFTMGSRIDRPPQDAIGAHRRGNQAQRHKDSDRERRSHGVRSQAA